MKVKIFLWAGKETTWSNLSLQGQKVYADLTMLKKNMLQVIAINNAAPTLPKPNNSFEFLKLYFHKDYILLKYKY